jgi:hypothetical protein
MRVEPYSLESDPHKTDPPGHREAIMSVRDEIAAQEGDHEHTD